MGNKNLQTYILGALIVLLVVPLMNTTYQTWKRSRAVAPVDTIYFDPTSAVVSKNTPTTIQVRANVGAKFAELIGIQIKFNTTLVNVASSGIVLHNTGLGSNNGIMTMYNSPASLATINSTGVINYVLMPAPDSADIRPSGDILLMEIPVISVNTGSSQIQTSFAFDASNTELLVGSTLTDPATPISLTLNPSVLTVEPATGIPTTTPSHTPSSTPSPTVPAGVTPSATMTPTHTQTPSSTPTPTGTSTPTNTPSPTQTITPLYTPTITITPNPNFTSTPSITPSGTPTPSRTPTQQQTQPSNTPIQTPTPTTPPIGGNDIPTITNSPYTCDINNDGRVNDSDFLVMLSHFLEKITGGVSMGDCSNNGVVDGVDYVIWMKNAAL